MKTKTMIVAAAIAASSGLAMADFDAEYLGRTGSGTIHIDNTGTGGVINQNFSAGHLEFAYTDVGGQRGGGQFSGGTFSTFCIELQDIQNGTHTYDVDAIQNGPNPAPGVGGPAYDSADEAEVHAVVAAAISLGWLNADLSAGASATDVRMTAIQGQIWKVLFDEAVVTGNGAVAPEMAALAAEIALNPTATVANMKAMLNATTQDQLFIVPLPTAAFAGLLTLGGLGAFSRIRRR